MNTNALTEYYDALERLKKDKPLILKKGTKITKDSVSLEAGRKKGSIKKSRIMFRDLIAAIDAAVAEQWPAEQQQTIQIQKIKQIAERLRAQLDAANTREISLLAELYETKKKLAKLTGENVLPIRKNSETELETD